MMSDISRNITRIREQVVRSCAVSGRDPESITCVAATKGVRPERIREAFDHGIQHFGENRVQEAQHKIPSLGIDVVWHMIGHLQSNKVKDAVNLFDMIQSVDSLHVAQKIHDVSSHLGKKMPMLMEVNIGREATKSGFMEEDVGEALKKIRALECLDVQGLMTVAPFASNPEDIRPAFRKMKQLFDHLGGMTTLSMGMSHDYTVALEEGANMIRIGRAIFGER